MVAVRSCREGAAFEPVDRTAHRHVLMVAFHYPPIAASAGALRSRAFASYLSDYGWQAHVLAPALSAYANLDPEAIEPIGPTVHRTMALDSKRHLSWRGHYSAFTAVPDRWISWAPAAVTRGLRIIRQYPIEAIWSTYPIPTAHLIASILSRLSGLPWLAEFRDPMRANGPAVERWAQNVIERRVMTHASRLVFVTPGARRDCEQRYPEIVGRTATIVNGYDETLSPPESVVAPATHVRPLRLLHTGHLYENGRRPQPLFQALEQLRRRGLVDAGRIQIVFRDSQSETNYQADIDRLGISDLVTMGERISHRRVLEEQAGAHALLLLQGQEFNLQIPAKLFEYLRARRPILSLVDPNGDTADLLNALGAGIQADASAPDAIADALLALLRAFENGDVDSLLVNPEKLAPYSRYRKTAELAALLDAMTEREHMLR